MFPESRQQLLGVLKMSNTNKGLSTGAWLASCNPCVLIHAGNSNKTKGQYNPSCGGNLSMNTGETKSFYCAPPLVGQFVYIRIPGSRKILSICEVQVYSTRRTSNTIKGNEIILSFSRSC